MRYKFFNELQSNHGPNTVLNVLRHVHLLKCGVAAYLIDEEDYGDRFYVILKGTVGVERATEKKVPNFDGYRQLNEKIYAYLQCLYDNFEKIFWKRVPYANWVRDYLLKIK